MQRKENNDRRETRGGGEGKGEGRGMNRRNRPQATQALTARRPKATPPLSRRLPPLAILVMVSHGMERTCHWPVGVSRPGRGLAPPSLPPTRQSAGCWQGCRHPHPPTPPPHPGGELTPSQPKPAQQVIKRVAPIHGFPPAQTVGTPCTFEATAGGLVSCALPMALNLPLVPRYTSTKAT